MADSLELSGKTQAMVGIKAAIVSVVLATSTNGVLSTASVTGAAFSVSGTTGQLANTEAAIEFTIGAEDVGETASKAIIKSSAGNMIIIDLETPVTLTTAGTATMAIGALTADL